MPTFVLTPEDLVAGLEGDSRAMFDQVVGAMRTEAKLRAEPILQRLISSENPPPVDRGASRRAFHVADIPNGVSVYNSSPYWAVIEAGRRPGARMPPVDLILEWVRRKGIGADMSGPAQQQEGPIQRGHRRSDRQAAVLRQQEWIALQIARKIAARGLRAHHILARMEQELTPIIGGAMARALGNPKP